MRVFQANGLRTSLPVYVTRHTARGETASYEMSIWMTMLAGLIVWLNIIIWGAIGLYVAVRTVL